MILHTMKRDHLTPVEPVSPVAPWLGGKRNLAKRITAILGSFAIIFSQMPFPSPTVPAEALNALPSHIHGLFNSPLQRLFLAVACVCLFLSLDRLRIVFSTFKAVLNARFEIAVEEAGRTLTEKAEGEVSIEVAFPQSPKFGRRVPLGQTNEV